MPSVRPVSPPEPDLDGETLIARAAALRPMLRDQGPAGDKRGWYGEEIHEAIRAAGLYRVVQPRLFGGYQQDFATFLKVIMEIARGHPASGWCYTLASSHAFLVASHWSAEAQAELFGDGDFRACQRATPAGEWKRVEGGYVISGTFGYCSGSPVSTHFVGAGVVEGEGAGGKRKGLNFIVPRAKYEVLDDWGNEATIGMSGSGSNSIRLADVFVPDRHITSNDVLLTTERMPEGGSPGLKLHGDPLYVGVIGGAYLTEFGAIMTGAARAALDEFEIAIRTQTTLTFEGKVPMVETADTQRIFGKAMNLVDSADGLTMAAVHMVMDQWRAYAENGRRITNDDTLKAWGMAQEACDLACRAVEMLFHASGPRSANGGERMARYFRDVQAYRVHVTAQPFWQTMRAQNHLGLSGGRL